MQLIPYLVFNGQCEAAFKFYEKVFGVKAIALMTFGDSPIAERPHPNSVPRSCMSVCRSATKS
jgi:PhnB protein